MRRLEHILAGRPQPFHHQYRLITGGAVASRSDRGKMTSKVLPLAAWLSTRRWPPRCFTMPSTIDNPNPVPSPTRLIRSSRPRRIFFPEPSRNDVYGLGVQFGPLASISLLRHPPGTSRPLRKNWSLLIDTHYDVEV